MPLVKEPQEKHEQVEVRERELMREDIREGGQDQIMQGLVQ